MFPAEMFAAPPPGADLSRAGELAAEPIADGGSVLDVGCGGGAAAFALVPPATSLIGSDRQADMVALFERTAAERGVPATTTVGSWPEVAAETPVADVAVSHNVLYNVPDLGPFVRALDDHARRRVVIEITERHPQTSRSPLWKRFWDLDRPDVPTAHDAIEAIADLGIDVRWERAASTDRDRTRAAPVEAAFWTRQLCLPPEREAEVAEAVADLEFPAERIVIWWDTA